jgi:hypothetical protein
MKYKDGRGRLVNNYTRTASYARHQARKTITAKTTTTIAATQKL